MAVVQGDEREKPPAAAARGHPLLRGWRRDRYTHGMHPAQMEALRAMCGALIPSLPADGAHGRGDPPGGKDLERFYRASAADSTIPDEVTAEFRSCLRALEPICSWSPPIFTVQSITQFLSLRCPARLIIVIISDRRT